MQNGLQNTALLNPLLAEQPTAAIERSAPVACFHCGEPCLTSVHSVGGKDFCCQGCRIVHDLLADNGLAEFYSLASHPGVRNRSSADRERWAYLDEPGLQQKLLDFTDGKLSCITLRVPAIHCVACVWLLENLFKLHPGIGQTRVNFPRREITVRFASEKIALSELMALLTTIGYEPQLTLAELDKAKPEFGRQRQWLQVGVAGFAFGNIMLFSLPGYLGMDTLSGPLFKSLFGYLSLGLALPVVVYSAVDYWQAALLSFRRRMLTLDVPIALGLAALYLQSAWEILAGHGEGYLDSLAGLVFFLLCGRLFQQITHQRMAFDRDYKCFFPLSVVRKFEGREESVALSNLRPGDRLILRHGELIPADSRLIAGAALIDYSFVTGESEPVTRQPGDYLYAGGQQIAAAIEVETVKSVSQSYLTSLWNHDAFRKESDHGFLSLTNRYSRRFTRIVIAVAVGAALFWTAAGQAGRGVKALTSVLIVACPCALALAAPFTQGAAQRLLARARIFLRNGAVLERMSQIDAIVFDKTGTLTMPMGHQVAFHGLTAEHPLSPLEERWVYSLARHSTHPLARRICNSFGDRPAAEPVGSFLETTGCGIEGRLDGHEIRLGSRAWLERSSVKIPDLALPSASSVHLAIDGKWRGVYVVANRLRPDVEQVLTTLARTHDITLLSGDDAREKARFESLFGENNRLHFNQSPLDKLGYIRNVQTAGSTVMMVGDGLNDAGALKQSDVGVAVVEKIGTFSPASDVILAAERLSQLSAVLVLARRAARIVRLSFLISGLYNVLGIAIAAAGLLSPIVCAILMPVSSISVVLFACGATHWAAKRIGLTALQ